MKLNPGTLNTIGSAIKPDAYAAGTLVPVTNTTAVKLDNTPAVTFFIDVGTVGASATLNAKIQRSQTGAVGTFSDQPSGEPGNDAAGAQITATGTQTLSINNPHPDWPYYALHVVTATAAIDFGAISIKGPLRHIEAE